MKIYREWFHDLLMKKSLWKMKSVKLHSLLGHSECKKDYYQKLETAKYKTLTRIFSVIWISILLYKGKTRGSQISKEVVDMAFTSLQPNG